MDETPTPARPRRGVILLVLFVVFLPLPASMVVATGTGADAVVLLSIVVSVILATVALRLTSSGWGELGMRRVRMRDTFGLAILAAIALLGVTIVFSNLLYRFAGIEPDISKFDELRGNPGALLGLLVVVWTTAAFGEEMLFRGLMLNAFRRLLGDTNDRAAWAIALVVTSVLFGAAHAYQGPAGIIITGIVGFGVGLLYLVTDRNLWVAILTHGIYDTMGFVFIYLKWDEIISSVATGRIWR